MPESCRQCGVGLPEREGRGRPADYCSVGCRRAAEYALRRAQRGLMRVEAEIRWHRDQLATRPNSGFLCCGRGEVALAHVETLRGEHAALEAVLAVLLGAPSVPPPDVELGMVEASAALVHEMATERCRHCASVPVVISVWPGTGLARAMELRHEPGCPDS
jgi:hypothetical protein